jgi:ECF sigma factor
MSAASRRSCRAFSGLGRRRRGRARNARPLVYSKFRRLAHRYMRTEMGHTLQTSALINEAYIRLIDSGRVKWQDCGALGSVSITAVFMPFPLDSSADESETPLPTSPAGLSMQFSGGVQAAVAYAARGLVNTDRVGASETNACFARRHGQRPESAPGTFDLAPFAPSFLTNNGQRQSQVRDKTQNAHQSARIAAGRLP